MKHHHREPEHLNSNKNKCAVIYLCPCAFFESFRRYLNEAKVVYISGYYLIGRFVIMMLRLRLKFRVTLLTINSRGGSRKFDGGVQTLVQKGLFDSLRQLASPPYPLPPVRFHIIFLAACRSLKFYS